MEAVLLLALVVTYIPAPVAKYIYRGKPEMNLTNYIHRGVGCSRVPISICNATGVRASIT